jgi:hypothetical protein
MSKRERDDGKHEVRDGEDEKDVEETFSVHIYYSRRTYIPPPTQQEEFGSFTDQSS